MAKRRNEDNSKDDQGIRYGVDVFILKKFKADFPLGKNILYEAGINRQEWNSLSDKVFTFETIAVLDDLISQCAGDYSFITRHEKMPRLRGTRLHPKAFFNLKEIGKSYEQVSKILGVSVDSLIEERLSPVYYGQVLRLYELSPNSKILVPKP